MLVEAPRAELVLVEVDTGSQSIARATVRAHRNLLIDDVEEDARVPGP
jgi:hypothetical protein